RLRSAAGERTRIVVNEADANRLLVLGNRGRSQQRDGGDRQQGTTNSCTDAHVGVPPWLCFFYLSQSPRADEILSSIHKRHVDGAVRQRCNYAARPCGAAGTVASVDGEAAVQSA